MFLAKRKALFFSSNFNNSGNNGRKQIAPLFSQAGPR
jgi:hypothetical protein